MWCCHAGLTFRRDKHCKGWRFKGAEPGLGGVQTRKTSCSARQPSVAGGTRTTSTHDSMCADRARGEQSQCPLFFPYHFLCYLHLTIKQ